MCLEQGPVLAENRKLIAKKLEEASQQTTNAEAAKQKKEVNLVLCALSVFAK